ncbi:MAG: sensor histidine kinase [Alphaproteobacteria bacterium]|nr:sensor histidine kinase [Alphaproteobacteria bacterium]
MGPITLILACLAVLSWGAMAALALRYRGQRRALAAVTAQRDRALAAELASTRLLRLSAAELRETALTLLGHTDKLQAAQEGGSTSSHATAIAAVTARVLNLADDLQDSGISGAETRVIRDEPLAVGRLLRDAIAAVSATLDPSQRHWRVAPELLELTLIADRRALSQILLRVLGNAARFTRDEDWIDLALERHEDVVSLVVADEGAGLAALAGSPEPAPGNSRGIGLGLSLARALMEAHGGTLTIETAARIGTRVTLSFPVERVPAQRLAA